MVAAKTPWRGRCIVVEDFRKALRKETPETRELVSLVTDNDRTGSSVETCSGATRALKE